MSDGSANKTGEYWLWYSNSGSVVQPISAGTWHRPGAAAACMYKGQCLSDVLGLVYHYPYSDTPAEKYLYLYRCILVTTSTVIAVNAYNFIRLYKPVTYLDLHVLWRVVRKFVWLFIVVCKHSFILGSIYTWLVTGCKGSERWDVLFYDWT